MFPIKDTIRSRSFPIITWGLIIINILIYFYESSLSQAGLNQLIATYGLIPSKISLTNPFTWLPLLTHMFLHGSWWHVLSNMWTLFIFGDNVEDRMGSVRYILFYLIGGIVAGMIQMLQSGDPNIPSIGASGAIAAVLGAYFLYFPKAKVVTFIPILLFIWFVKIPAVVYLGIWFISQLYSGITSASASSIAWWAHIGGFVFGLLLALVFKSLERTQKWHRDEYYPW